MAEDNAATLMTPDLAAAQAALVHPAAPLAQCRQGGLEIELSLHDTAIWVKLRRDDSGGLALRMPVFSPDVQCRAIEVEGALAAIECSGRLGLARLILRGDAAGTEQLRATLDFTPTAALSLGELPRDLVPFGAGGDPQAARIKVEATQRKLNTALVYFTVERPEFGKVLYLQNLTALNPYFNATGSKPENAVKGDRAELGYAPPLNPETGRAVLPAGETITLYDTLLAVRRYPRHAEDDSAWQFLDMLGALYPWIDRPEPELRDWPGRAAATIHDLMHAPEAAIEHYGHRYFHPYTASEYPDVMVQLAIGAAIDEWGRWRGLRHPLLREIMAGIDRFHDQQLGTLRRYLPNVGKDKDADAVDSWYLYHPLLNLAKLAIAGEEKARELFLATIDYGIKAARHFNYCWPIMFNIRDFSVIRAVAEADQRGQTDVGGIYAWVMLQAFELTHDCTYLDEAVAAIDAAKGMRFDLNYQANLTAWGAAACIRLWRITERKTYLTQSYVYIASFLHNCQIWESEIGLAQHSRNFMGVTCLQDAPYMAAYECYDSFAAFERYLDYGGPDLIPAVKLLLGEYGRYALDRAWFYYPDALPEAAIATENRNGYICRALNFPLEDLYPDDQQAGQVGQEVYGCGAAMTYATRAFNRIDGAPFLVFCDCHVRAIHRLDDHTVSLRIDGAFETAARIVLVPDAGADLTDLQPALVTRGAQPIALRPTKDRWEATVPANAALLLSWQAVPAQSQEAL